jgi:hypothetical protein
VVDTIHDVIGGRNVRVPIGIAGFLNQAGGAQIAAGSISTADTQAIEAGESIGITGEQSVKLRVPGPAKFAPSWISKVTETARGHIFENYDEYPLKKAARTVEDLLPWDDLLRATERDLTRQESARAIQKHLLAQNLAAASGSLLGDLAEGVAFAKGTFGMAMSAAAFVSDPLSVAKASLGIGVGTQSNSRIAGRRDQLEAQGIKVSKNAGGTTGLGQYVGFKAANTFKEIGNNIGEAFGVVDSDADTGPASIGEVYGQSAYQQQLAEADENDLVYDPAYENKDYAALLAVDPTTQNALSEVYGDNNSAPEGSDIDPASLEEVYGTGSSSSARRSPAEIAALLAEAQSQRSTKKQNDEDTSGIRGIADDDAEIDAIV